MKKFKIGLGILVVIIGLYFFSNTPAKGKIVQKSSSVVTNKVQKMLEYDGADLKFNYPGKYSLREENGSVQLIGGAGVPVTVVITTKAFNGLVADVNGVKMRQIKTAEYQEESIDYGLMFVHHDPLELAAFFVKKGKSLTVTLTTNTNDEKSYREEFKKLVESVEVK